MTADITIHYQGPTTRDAYNQVVHTGKGGTSVTVKGYYRPRRSNTIVAGGDVLTSDASIIIQADVKYTEIESVMIEGQRFEPDGEPMPHWNPLKNAIEYIRIDLRKGNN
jgi:adenine deaminase